jgi:hypothetical protein
MQVILVCVAHAAQKAWMKRRTAGGDPGVDVIQEEIPATVISEIIAFEEDPAAAPRVPFRTSWDSFAGMGKCQVRFPGGPVFPADSGQHR